MGEPPNRIPAEALRRRMVRRRALEYLATAVVAVLLVSLGVVAATVRAAAPAPADGTGLHAGQPRFYVEQGFTKAPPASVVVRKTATGAVTAKVSCPWPGAKVPDEKIVADGQHTFSMLCEKPAGRAGSPAVTGSRIYQFTLTGSGQIRGYSLLPGGDLPGLRASNLAVSADGTHVAVTVTAGDAGFKALPEIMVITARTGARAVWRNDPLAAGPGQYSVFDLSLTADGHVLMFRAIPQCPKGPNRQGCKVVQLRTLTPGATGGLLDSSRLLFRQTSLPDAGHDYVNGAWITPDGSAVTVVGLLDGLRVPHSRLLQSELKLFQVSASTGRPLRTLYVMHTGTGFLYRFVSSDASGRFILLNVGSTSRTRNGWVDHGRLIRLEPGGDNVFWEAW